MGSWALRRDGHRKFLQSQGRRPFRVVGRPYVDVAAGRQAPFDQTRYAASAELIGFQDPIEWSKTRARALVVIPLLEHPADHQRPRSPFGHLAIDRWHARMDRGAVHGATRSKRLFVVRTENLRVTQLDGVDGAARQ